MSSNEEKEEGEVLCLDVKRAGWSDWETASVRFLRSK